MSERRQPKSLASQTALQQTLVTELKQVIARRFSAPTALLSGGSAPVMRTMTATKYNDPPLVKMPSGCSVGGGQIIDSGTSADAEQMTGDDDPFEQWTSEQQFIGGSNVLNKQPKVYTETTSTPSPVANTGRHCTVVGRIRHCYPETYPNLDLDYRLALDLEKITKELSKLGNTPFELLSPIPQLGWQETSLVHSVPPNQSAEKTGALQEESMGNLCADFNCKPFGAGDDDNGGRDNHSASGPPLHGNSFAEMARFKHFVVSVYQDYEHLPHLDLGTLRTLVNFGRRGETRLRHLWLSSAKSAERHKLISYVSTFHRINSIMRNQLKQREEIEALGNIDGQDCFERLKPLPFFSPLIAFARKLQMENQLYSASLPVEYIINYPERLSNIKESSEEVDGVLQRQSFKHIVNARDINENPDDNNDGNDKEETNIPIIPPFILKRRTRRFN